MEELGKVLKRRLGPGSTSENTAISPRNDRPAGVYEGSSGTPLCSMCRGHGWVVLDVSVDHPDFGKSFPCRCTLRQFERERLSRMERHSNLGALARLNFDNLHFNDLENYPEKRRHYQLCCEEARGFAAEPKGWLVLTGPSGCGKTHLAAAIANECLKRGIPAFFVIVPDLLDHLRATFSPASDVAYDDLFEQVRNAPLLFLDDLGVHSSTPWAGEKLFQILNHRFNCMLPTVVTTIAIGEVDERLQTRLRNPAICRELALRRETAQLFRHVGGLGLESLSRMSFDNFDTQGMNADREGRQSLKIALEAASQFAEAPENWLVLVGPPGSGKTHLAASIANHQLALGRPVFFAGVPELLDHLRPAFGAEAKGQQEIGLDGIKASILLILDDLGLETTSPWAREKLYQILNYRYNARLSTVVTITHPSLESLDARLRSRLMDPKISNVIPIGAPDYRGHVKPAARTRRGR